MIRLVCFIWKVDHEEGIHEKVSKGNFFSNAHYLWDQGRFFNSTGAGQTQTIKFLAADNVEVTADLYLTDNKKAPFIIRFHQVLYSRGEYAEIAPKTPWAITAWQSIKGQVAAFVV